jgi:restriction system protein
MTKKSLVQFLEEAKAVADSRPLEMSVRDLLRRWDYQRRSVPRVERIDKELGRFGLRTEPPLYGAGWIENRVALVPLEAAGESHAPAPAEQEVGLRVGQLKAAGLVVAHVKREASLSEARTKMMLHDYSQLAVWNGRHSDVMAVTWESIAKAQLCQQDVTLKDATVPARVVDLDDDLIPLLSIIAKEGFVFVRGKDRDLCGIVTSADLSVEFETLAGPFFLIGEIERRLRRVVDTIFTRDEIQEMRKPSDDGRLIKAAEDLNFGEIVRQLEEREKFDRTGWPVDRALVVERLNRIREIRNDLMHFSPDPPDEEDRELMRNFLMMLRALVG